MKENQRFRELATVANLLENRLFLASVTMPRAVLGEFTGMSAEELAAI
jgi:hypothetical protein